MRTLAPPDIYKMFSKHIEENDITVSDIAKATKISNTHLHFILKGERNLTERKRKKLNAYLKTAF